MAYYSRMGVADQIDDTPVHATEVIHCAPQNPTLLLLVVSMEKLPGSMVTVAGETPLIPLFSE